MRLRVVGCDDLSTGTAFHLRGVGLVTNRHLVVAMQRIDAETWDGLELATQATTTFDDVDLAVVALDGSPDPQGTSFNLAALTLQTRQPRPGDHITVLGFPRGRRYEEHRGTMVALSDDGHGNAILVLDVAAEPGNSGSPVLNDAGEVVGIVYARRTDNGQILAIPAARLSQLDDDLRLIGNRPTQPAPTC